MPVDARVSVAGHSVGIDKNALRGGGRHPYDQAGQLAAWIAPEVKSPSPGHREIREDGQGAVEFGDPGQQSPAVGQRVEHRSGVGGLAVEPSASFLTPPVLHPPVGVGNTGSKIGVANHLYPCLRRGCDHHRARVPLFTLFPAIRAIETGHSFSVTERPASP